MKFYDLKWFFFDFDGTLADTAGDIIDNLQRAYNTVPGFGHVDASKVRIGPPLDIMIRNQAPSATNEDIKRLTFEYMKMYEIRDFKRTRFYDGAVPLVDSLIQRNKTVGLVTNKPLKNLRLLFEKLGGLEKFSLIMTPDSRDGIKLSKGEMFAELTKGGVHPEMAVMVGDSPADISSARENGVKTIGILEGYTPKEEMLLAAPDVSVKNIADLNRLAESLSF